MKIALLIAVALVTLSSIPLFAQQADANANVQQNSSATAAGTHMNSSGGGSAAVQASPRHAGASGQAAGSAVAASGPAMTSGSANGSALAATQMSPVNAELLSKLDSKSARVGERVVARTKQTIRTADGTVIPKGSRLLGHVTEAQAHERGHQDSSLGIAFDRAELKGGQSMAIHSVIRSIAPPANAIGSSGMDDDGMMAPMAPMGGGMVGGGPAMGGRAGGGGLLGGTVGGAAAATGQMGAGLGSSLDTTAGNTMRTTGNVAGNAAAGVGNGLHGAAGAAGELGARATAIPGVMLNSNAGGAASGMLTATKRNVHLDSGTQMVLGIAAAGQMAKR